MGMTATERKELRKLIDDEFASAKSYVVDLADQARADAEADVEKQFASQLKALGKLTDKIEQIEKKAEQDIAAVHSEIKALGAVKEYRGWSLGDMDKQAANARKRIDVDVQAAFRELDRRRRAVEKDLILGSLETEDARKFVDSIPNISSIVTSGPLQKALQAAEKS